MKLNFFQIFDLKDQKSAKLDFLKSYTAESAPLIKISVVVAGLFLLLLGFVDCYAAPAMAVKTRMLNYGINLGILIGALLFTYSRHLVRFGQLFSFLLSMFIGVSVIITIPHGGDGLAQLYFSCLILVIIWTHTILRLQFNLAVASTIAIIITYNLFFYFRENNALLSNRLLTANFYLVTAFVLGAWSTRSTERMFLKNYMQYLQLSREREKLANSEAQLKEADKMKAKLFSIISSDLRKPISGLLAILNLYNSGAITSEEFKRHLKNITISIDSLSVLCDNLLSWSIIQINDSRLQMKETNIWSIVSNVFSNARPLAERKGIRLHNEVDGNIEVLCDPVMIELVVRNLILNAIKFTEKGKITVSAAILGNQLRTQVEDTGCGIPREVASKLFDWNYRTSTLGTKFEKGSGIGLLLCKEFIEKHGGVLSFSTEIDKGTRFYFSLPAGQTLKK